MNRNKIKMNNKIIEKGMAKKGVKKRERGK